MQSRTYGNVGPEQIQSFDRMIGPEGKELAIGRGTSREGAEIFAKRCEVYHGKNGEAGQSGVSHSAVPASFIRAPLKITK